MQSPYSYSTQPPGGLAVYYATGFLASLNGLLSHTKIALRCVPKNRVKNASHHPAVFQKNRIWASKTQPTQCVSHAPLHPSPTTQAQDAGHDASHDARPIPGLRTQEESDNSLRSRLAQQQQHHHHLFLVLLRLPHPTHPTSCPPPLPPRLPAPACPCTARAGSAIARAASGGGEGHA